MDECLITERIRKYNVETFMEFVQSSITKDFGFSDDEVMYSLRETMDKLKVSERWIWKERVYSIE